jgi:inhibitor of cysteine peptidase
LASLIGLLVACAAAREVTIGENEMARTVTAEPGEEFAVLVETNASIGWEWEITAMPDPTVATFVERSYEADDPEAIGSGGTDAFTFRAVGTGGTTVTLTRTYRDEGPDREVTITVRVRSA